jgi:hypothetical protein
LFHRVDTNPEKIGPEVFLIRGSQKVLAITQRTADLCATQSLLYAAGYELITATNLQAARALIRSLPICGLIICYHSWTEAEREHLAAELSNIKIPSLRCPGCTGSDETCGKVGKLDNLVPLTALMAAFGEAPR